MLIRFLDRKSNEIYLVDSQQSAKNLTTNLNGAACRSLGEDRAYFLKSAENISKQEFEKLIQSYPIMKKAFNQLEEKSLSKEELEVYNRAKIEEMDRISHEKKMADKEKLYKENERIAEEKVRLAEEAEEKVKLAEKKLKQLEEQLKIAEEKLKNAKKL